MHKQGMQDKLIKNKTQWGVANEGAGVVSCQEGEAHLEFVKGVATMEPGLPPRSHPLVSFPPVHIRTSMLKDQHKDSCFPKFLITGQSFKQLKPYTVESRLGKL